MRHVYHLLPLAVFRHPLGAWEYHRCCGWCEA
jgi:hypothetical protein